MDMEIEFTKHFWLRWEKRKEDMIRNGVTPEMIKEFAINPDMIIEDPKHKGVESKESRRQVFEDCRSSSKG